MPRKLSEATTKCTMKLFSADLEELKSLYPKAGYSRVVRALIRKHLNEVAEARNNVAQSIEIELSEEDLTHEEPE